MRYSSLFSLIHPSVEPSRLRPVMQSASPQCRSPSLRRQAPSVSCRCSSPEPAIPPAPDSLPGHAPAATQLPRHWSLVDSRSAAIAALETPGDQR